MKTHVFRLAYHKANATRFNQCRSISPPNKYIVTNFIDKNDMLHYSFKSIEHVKAERNNW